MTKDEMAQNNLEIAMLVYRESNPVFESVGADGGTKIQVLRLDNGMKLYVPDYYNNWNDLMPLVVEHEISLTCLNREHGKVKWLAENDYDETTRTWSLGISSSAQHALANCLLEVLREKAKDK